jgi:hypothetical protein
MKATMDITDRNERFLIRCMNSAGTYPRVPLAFDGAYYSGCNDYGPVYTVVRDVPDFEDEYTELLWGRPSEIRLWASLLLSVPEGEGMVCIYPNNDPLTLDFAECVTQDFTSEEFSNQVAELVGQGRAFQSQPPPIFQSRQWNAETVKDQRVLFFRIPTWHRLLIRGLSTLLKSQMLWQHPIFQQEAVLLLYISLEASLELIRENIVGTVEQPGSYQQAFNYISKTLRYGKPLAEFFKECCYENRIIIVHPNSRFGSYSAPPLCADDFYDTYGTVVTMYRHLLIGADRPRQWNVSWSDADAPT